MDYLLRTNTKEQMEQKLIDAALLEVRTVDGEEVKLPVSGVYIDHIGTITKSAVTEGEGEDMIITIPSTTDSRWHTNIRVAFELTEEQIAALPQVDPPPSIPYRVFA
jgi:hypothetical protein